MRARECDCVLEKAVIVILVAFLLVLHLELRYLDAAVGPRLIYLLIADGNIIPIFR